VKFIPSGIQILILPMTALRLVPGFKISPLEAGMIKSLSSS
jgi:hypothetical protein